VDPPTSAGIDPFDQPTNSGADHGMDEEVAFIDAVPMLRLHASNGGGRPSGRTAGVRGSVPGGAGRSLVSVSARWRSGRRPAHVPRSWTSRSAANRWLSVYPTGSTTSARSVVAGGIRWGGYGGICGRS
jgi:hypothetical protein